MQQRQRPAIGGLGRQLGDDQAVGRTVPSLADLNETLGDLAVAHPLEALRQAIAEAKTSIELREKGGQLGQVVHLGQLVIGNAPQGA